MIGDDALGVVFKGKARAWAWSADIHAESRCTQVSGGAPLAPGCAQRLPASHARALHRRPPDTDEVLCMDRYPFPGHE